MIPAMRHFGKKGKARDTVKMMNGCQSLVGREQRTGRAQMSFRAVKLSVGYCNDG